MQSKNNRQNVQISRNNRIDLKNQLSFLATTAKKRLDQNQNLKELIKIKRNQISRNKENLSKFSVFNSQKNKGNELGNKIIKEIKLNNKELISLNIYLHKQIDNLNNKYISMKNLFLKNNEILKNNLDILKDRQFIYENALKEKEFKINKLTNCINDFYIKFYNDEVIDIFPDEEYLDPDDEFNTNLNIYKDLLFSKCLGFNKYKKMSTELKKKRIELKNKIKSINKYINTLKNVNANFDCIDFSNYNNNIYIEGEECLNNKSDFNNNLIINTEDSFFESSSIENENLDSFNFISNYFFEEKTKIKLNLSLPKIDLSQINYNKKKMKLEDKEKSLSRNNRYSKKKESKRLNRLKNKIKINIEKKEMYIASINKYKKKIKELKDNFRTFKSPPSQSLKIKSIKKRTFLLNSTSSLQNNSFYIKNKIISSNELENLNKDKNNSSIKYYK